MRMSLAAVIGGMVVALVGCSGVTLNTSGGPGGDGSKLKEQVVGKWEGAEGGETVTYEFKNDGTYTKTQPKLAYSGKWKAVDDGNLEFEFTLTPEQLAAAKEAWKVTKDEIEKLPKFGPVSVPVPPEPTEKNTIKMNASVAGDELTLGGMKYKKK